MDIIPLEAVRLWLLANCLDLANPALDSFINPALFPSIIYGPAGLPKPVIQNMPRRVITFYQSGSIVNLCLHIDEVLIVFLCYGETPYYADAVFRALDNCLHRQTCLSTGVSPAKTIGYTSFRTAGPADAVEPDTGWARIMATYRIRYWESLI